MSNILADGLIKMKAAHDRGVGVFRSQDFTRGGREALLHAGFLKPIINGWFHTTSPKELDHITTPWAMCYWEFLSRYADARFDMSWSLTPESAMGLITDDQTPSKSLTIIAPKGNNREISLPHGYKIFVTKGEVNPHEVRRTTQGVRVPSDISLLCRLEESAYERSAIEVSSIISRTADWDLLAYMLISNNGSKKAGHILSAMESMGFNDEIQKMKSLFSELGFRIRRGPVSGYAGFGSGQRGESALSIRLKGYWEQMRENVLSLRPEKSDVSNISEVMERVSDAYERDAWHSLPIEGYTVNADLLDRVKTGTWNPDMHEGDLKYQDALAAKGYFDAFQKVKQWIKKSLSGIHEPDGFEPAQRNWHEVMFRPSIEAGILKPHQAIGFRNHPVFIRTAQHVPPASERLMDGMSTYHSLLADEPDSFVRAVLGHWLLGYIHPFTDGNGRLARFTMNAMLVTGGYDWTVIQLNEKEDYMRALDIASCQKDIRPFASFITNAVSREKVMREEKRDIPETPGL